ncbi:hypothetical protein [Fictibacillus phosphorivorans]|uniref:hypothetical protein n=1 Tax=Fictibacillus phosphorivorans TaxID=1221500 RepID=UPI001293BC0A|nr:hypothetical protein [Fictibacillus phosphorivorans]MQR94839.1 hypothetical protein [Fictibacillus phosphorivorans]
MTQIIVLLVSTLIVGSLLYFYPPNVKRPLKMTILGLAFLLALGGLFILNNLSFGLALTAMMSIAFIASYIAAKKFNLVSASTGQSDIVFSFSQNEIAAEKYVQENLIEQDEHAAAIEELVMSSELDNKIKVFEEGSLITEDLQALDPNELLDLDIDEIIAEEEKMSIDIVLPVEELETEDILSESIEDEFEFLKETREISDEELTNMPIATDIENEEILLQRASLLEEISETDTIVETPENIEILSLDEIIEPTEELSHDKNFISEDNESSTESILEELLEVVDTEELLTTIEETNTEEAHIMEEPIIEVEITLEEPIEVESEIETTPMEEVVETVEPAEEISSFEEQDEFPVTDTEEVVTGIEEVEASITESVEIGTPDMNVELQDMFLSTLHSYKESGNHSSYQEMLVTLLNQKLSHKDFYLFSKLLLDSYMTSSDLSNVNPLIETMEEKLSHYPVIVEELQRYKEMNK